MKMKNFTVPIPAYWVWMNRYSMRDRSKRTYLIIDHLLVTIILFEQREELNYVWVLQILVESDILRLRWLTSASNLEDLSDVEVHIGNKCTYWSPVPSKHSTRVRALSSVSRGMIEGISEAKGGRSSSSGVCLKVEFWGLSDTPTIVSANDTELPAWIWLLKDIAIA